MLKKSGEPPPERQSNECKGETEVVHRDAFLTF